MSVLLTTQDMGEADRLTIAAGTPGNDLMETAGAGVARVAMAGRAPGRMAVLCGPGNNGGDGFVIARLAQEAGWQVSLALIGDPASLTGDAALAAARWPGPVQAPDPLVLEGADVIIDALFGAGLTRPVDGAAAALVNAVNASPGHVVAVDVPSGVDGNTGQVRGPAIVADETVTFFRAKPGHWVNPGRTLCGQLHVIDIGIPARVLETIRPRIMLNTPDLWADHFPWPAWDTHKYKRGHGLVVSGGTLTSGAARLGARGALRAGAGLVTVLTKPAAALVHAAHLTAIMVRRYDTPGELAGIVAERKATAALIGPGAGVTMETADAVRALTQTGIALVLDADALTVFQDDPEALFARLRHNTVLTPHDGEFARLFPGLLDESETRLAAARTAAERAGCVVLLKGPETLLASPDGRLAVTANAPPTLATAGSGDVLAGIITGLLTQGMAPFEAACAGAWLHGDAAARFGPGLIAEDLPDLLPQSLSALAG